jgi:hypothetical protein
MKIVMAKAEPSVSIKSYTIKHDGETFIYKDYLDGKGKVIDSQLLDADGFGVFEPALMEEIQKMVDSYEEDEGNV